MTYLSCCQTCSLLHKEMYYFLLLVWFKYRSQMLRNVAHQVRCRIMYIYLCKIWPVGSIRIDLKCSDRSFTTRSHTQQTHTLSLLSSSSCRCTRLQSAAVIMRLGDEKGRRGRTCLCTDSVSARAADVFFFKARMDYISDLSLKHLGKNTETKVYC